MISKRLEELVKNKTTLLEGKRIVVTGCGYKPLQHIFYDIVTGEPSHDSIEVNGKEMKLNIGSAIAFVLAVNGAMVHMVSRTEEKLDNIKDGIIKTLEIQESNIGYSALDLLNEKEVKKFTARLPKDKPIYLVQSIGLGAGAYKVKDNNPYLHLEDIPLELLEKEATTVLRGTHLLIQNLLPIFKKQNETRIAVITSMSAIRSYTHGGTHCAAKGAISRYTNSAMLDLWKEKIYITDVRPGAVDTGMYDNKIVQKAILKVDKEYGDYWNKYGITLAPPISIGEAINMILTIPAHITSLNLVARGQFPNEGS